MKEFTLDEIQEVLENPDKKIEDAKNALTLLNMLSGSFGFDADQQTNLLVAVSQLNMLIESRKKGVVA